MTIVLLLSYIVYNDFLTVKIECNFKKWPLNANYGQLRDKGRSDKLDFGLYPQVNF